ncbi:MAG TPA: glycosyltransferase family 2 protein [Candidatus Cybelea sp.]|nr:glycosyltransferase family 2 protein [Candidatus Cybelea sp.]
MTLHQADKATPSLSIVVPMFNEAGNLDRLLDRLEATLQALVLDYEIVCVDDGSRDDTLVRVLGRRQRNPRIKVLALSRNFGKEVALTAGIAHAAGAAVVAIDADLQHPPELIAELVARWREGYDVAYAVRRSRVTDSLGHRFGAKAFYWIFSHLAETKLPEGAGDFRLMDRRVVDALNRMPERARFMKGLFAWVGFKQIAVPFEPSAREDGASRWAFLRLWRFALDGLTSFSTLPLRIWFYVGVGLALPSLGFGVFELVRTIVQGIDVPGYASVFVAVVFLGGVQLLSLGIIGEYVGRIFAEVNERPLYLVRERFGFDDELSRGADVRRIISGR